MRWYRRERATYLVRVALEVRRGLVRLTFDRVCCRLGICACQSSALRGGRKERTRLLRVWLDSGAELVRCALAPGVRESGRARLVRGERIGSLLRVGLGMQRQQGPATVRGERTLLESVWRYEATSSALPFTVSTATSVSVPDQRSAMYSG